MREPRNLGGKIADIVSRAHVDTKRRMMPEMVDLAMQMQEAFFALTGSEHRATSGGFWRQLLATDKLSGAARDTVAFLADGHGQWQTLLAGTATGAAMGGGILDIVTNELAPAVQAALALNPHKLLAPADLAAAYARGILDPGSAIHEAAKGGLNEGNFRTLVDLNIAVPSPFEMGILLNRGLVDSPTAHNDLRRGGMETKYIDLMLQLREQLLTPQELATLVTFGVLTEEKAAVMAERSGTSAADFHLLVMGNGQPPSNEELLFAYRRGIIDKARLLRGITQGPVRNEWFDVIESLGQVPMSTADAIQAAIQGHLTKAEAQHITAQNGLLPVHFEPLFQTAGSPPGPQQMMVWWRRGLISEAGVRQALTESRLKPKYVDLILATKAVLPPMTVIRSAFARGAISHARALQLLAEHGYTPEDAAMILAEAHAEKTATVRQLTVAQVMELRTERIIDEQTAHGMLTTLGYSDHDAAWVMELADLARHRKLMDASIARVRAAYVGRHIDEAQVHGALDALLVPVDQKDDLLMHWDIERSTVTKTLTLAQAEAAFKKGLMGADEFQQRVQAMGYAPADVTILVGLATAGRKA